MKGGSRPPHPPNTVTLYIQLAVISTQTTVNSFCNCQYQQLFGGGGGMVAAGSTVHRSSGEGSGVLWGGGGAERPNYSHWHWFRTGFCRKMGLNQRGYIIPGAA